VSNYPIVQTSNDALYVNYACSSKGSNPGGLGSLGTVLLHLVWQIVKLNKQQVSRQSPLQSPSEAEHLMMRYLSSQLDQTNDKSFFWKNLAWLLTVGFIENSRPRNIEQEIQGKFVTCGGPWYLNILDLGDLRWISLAMRFYIFLSKIDRRCCLRFFVSLSNVL
jgi:hypothetical protein